MDSLKGITIHQEISIKASPERLYAIFLSSKQFSECTKILELVPDQRIVEAWRVKDWPAGVYSIAKFEFKPQGFGYPDNI